jgi:N-acetylmuramoyl-L-alanine amidase
VGGGAAVFAVRGSLSFNLFGRGAEAAPPLAASVASRSVAASATTAGRVEVPNVEGMPLVQAQTLLQTAGLSTRVSVLTTLAASAEQDVAAQGPSAGAVVATGSVVTVSVPPLAKGKPVSAPKASHKGPLIVVIDPGHQSKADSGLEPIGPGSIAMQPKQTAGSSSSGTGIPESEINLQIATNLKDRLVAQGVKVIMTRTTNDVDLSNAQRAQIANAAKADLFVRIHADSGTSAADTGVLTLFPGPNQWTKNIVGPSQRVAQVVQGATVASTGAKDNGEAPRLDQAGFNWAKVPAILVNVGNSSNQVEDRLLGSARYQDQLAQGMSAGILTALGVTR